MDDGLYPEIEPYQQAKLEREGHSLYYELSGNPTDRRLSMSTAVPGAGPHRECAAFLILNTTASFYWTSVGPDRASRM